MPSITQTIEKLQKKLEKDPNSHLFSQLAEEHRKEGNFEEAIRILKTGLARHPNYWSAHVTLGRVYLQMGNTPYAREELEKVVRAVPDNLLANRLLGDIYTSIQLPGEALKRYRIVHMLSPGDQEIGATIQRLESEVAEDTPMPVPEIQIQPASEPEPPVEPEPSAIKEELEEEAYAPTIQMQIPDYLDKTEVPVAADSSEISGSSSKDEEVMNNSSDEPAKWMTLPDEILSQTEPEPADSEQGVESEGVAEVEGEALTPDTLILEGPIASFEENISQEGEQDAFDEPKDSDELSTLADLLLSTEPPSIAGHQFEELEEDEVEEYQPDTHQDRTQPIQESEEVEGIEEVDELTSETLAELYYNQGLIDKAVKVYERLLLSNPGNPEIVQRLKELSPDGVARNGKESVDQEQELLLVEQQGSTGSGISVGDMVTRRDYERQRKISRLEHWLTTIRRERD